MKILLLCVKSFWFVFGFTLFRAIFPNLPPRRNTARFVCRLLSVFSIEHPVDHVVRALKLYYFFLTPRTTTEGQETTKGQYNRIDVKRL